jgi:hypothetical protein
MPKCPQCPRFTSKDTSTDPEIDIEIDADGRITGSVRIVNTCEECGEEMEQHTFDVEADVSDEFVEHKKGTPATTDHELEVEYTDESRLENGTGRKRTFGYTFLAKVTCACSGEEFATADVSDMVSASEMESLA